MMNRRYRSRFSRRTFSKNRPIFPDRLFTKFRLSRNDVDISITNNPAITRNSFDLYPNSLYDVDPFATRVPLNYNVYLGPLNGAQPYHRYMVYGAKIDWTLHCAANNQLRVATLVWDAQDWEPDPLWNFADYAEQRDRCRVYNVGSIQGGDAGIFRGSTYIGMPKIFNISKSDLLSPGNDSDYSGYFNTSPLNYCKFRLIVEKIMPNVVVNVPIYCDYSVTFYTMLYDRNQNVSEIRPNPPGPEEGKEKIEMLPDDPDPESVEEPIENKPIPTYEELLKLYNNS